MEKPKHQPRGGYAVENWHDIKPAYSSLLDFAATFDLPDSTIEDALGLYIDYRESEHGFNNASRVIAAAVILVSHQGESPLPIKYVEQKTNIENISAEYRRMSGRLGLEVMPPKAQKYTGTLVDIGEISETWGAETEVLLSEGPSNAGGASPIVNLGAGLYASQLVSRELFKEYTQETIADMLGISKLSIRNNYKRFVEFGEGLKHYGNAKV